VGARRIPADEIRDRLGATIDLGGGARLGGRQRLKELLVSEGRWSQYLEVGIARPGDLHQAPVLSSMVAGRHRRAVQLGWNNRSRKPCSWFARTARSRRDAGQRREPA